jgi:hypothetical protein
MLGRESEIESRVRLVDVESRRGVPCILTYGQERQMGELKQLKKENKQLKALLKNAVQLLDRYKSVLQRAAPQPAKKKKVAKKSPPKKSRA